MMSNIHPIKPALADSKKDPFTAMIPEYIWKYGGLIELIVDDYQMEELELLLPALAQRSHMGRWLAWVSAPYKLSPGNSLEHAINPARLLRIYPTHQGPDIRLLSRALGNGRCSSIVAWSTPCDERETRQLINAARRGNTLGILVIKKDSVKDHISNADLRLSLCKKASDGEHLQPVDTDSDQATGTEANSIKIVSGNAMDSHNIMSPSQLTFF